MCFAGFGFGRKEKRGFRLRALGLLYFQHKIFVWDRGTTCQLNMLAAIGESAHGNLMRDRLYGAEFETGIEIHGQRNVVARAAVRMANRRSDSRSVRHRVAIRGPSSSVMTYGLCSGDVARPH